MSKANDCWGIEIGANALKAVRLVRKGQEITLTDYDILPFKKVLTSPDLNVAEAIQVQLDQFLSRHNVSRSSVVVSVPGHVAFARFAKLPPVEPKRIPDIVRFEAVQQIPFPIDEVEWDYQIFTSTDSPDVEVGIFAITKERLADIMANYEAVGLTIDGMTLSPLAVYNGLAHDLELDEKSPGVIFMDIGTTSTDVIIVEEGNLWLRTLPIGGSNFTEALVRSFKLSFPKAEKLKREAGTSKYARQIFQAMRPVFADLVQELQRSLGFYQSLNRDAKLTRLIGVGSTFKLPGMAKFLKQQLQIEVVRPDGFSGVTIDTKLAADFAEHALNMATAYGLALQGLGEERVDANILPREVLKKRVWRAKQPWVGAAAAVMIAATGLAWGRLSMEQAAYKSSFAANHVAIDKAINDAKKLKAEFDNVQKMSNPGEKINRLNAVLSWRDLWPLILKDIDLAKMSLDPQQPIIDGDWDKILQIKRQLRRQMLISTVRTEYLYKEPGPLALWSGGGGIRFGSLASTERSGDMAMGMTMGGMGPGGGMPGMGSGLDLGGLGGMTGAATGPDNPSFKITIEGTTPYSPDAYTFLSKTFIQWLKTPSDPRDLKHAGVFTRPYRIIPESAKLEWMAAVESSSGGTTTETLGGRSRGRTREPSITMTPRSAARTRAPGAFPGITTSTPSRESSTDILAVLPAKPDMDEPRDTDQKFQISWRIELVKPAAAGSADPGVPKTMAPSDSPQATALPVAEEVAEEVKS